MNTSLQAWQPSSPKQRAGDANWYPYYAGYSSGFVRDVLGHLELAGDGVILDPWNGSGTTTTVAQEMGFESHGYDLNPALVTVARARMLGRETHDSLLPLAKDLLAHAHQRPSTPETGLLRRWLTAGSAARIRAIDLSIRDVLCPTVDVDGESAVDASALSSLAAFFYVCLFGALRDLLPSFRSTNPTWIRSARSEAEQLDVDEAELTNAFVRYVGSLSGRMSTLAERPAILAVGDSLALADEGNTVAGVITSPPYCTRIDYVIGSLPELAVLGHVEADIDRLRIRMLGTPKLGTKRPTIDERWGPSAHALLEAVNTHASKASATYYSTFFLQYLDRFFRSLLEIRRVLRPTAPLVLVLQDSFYKEVRINLAQIAAEMLRAVEFSSIDHFGFSKRNVIAASNPKTRAYRTTFTATESVLICR